MPDGFESEFGLNPLDPNDADQDLDEDGYEDTTGLPTHYDECYSGFKGNAGSSFKDASCELGGKYLIPMFKEIYQESTTP